MNESMYFLLNMGDFPASHVSFSGVYDQLAGGFKYFLFSPRKLGKIPILTNIFQGGWFNHQLVNFGRRFPPDFSSYDRIGMNRPPRRTTGWGPGRKFLLGFFSGDFSRGDPNSENSFRKHNLCM